MMRKWMLFIIAILAIIPVIALAGKTSGKKQSGAMNVQVREAIVRSSPSYTGGTIGKVTYGTQVTVTSEEGNWFQIDSPNGWLPKSALTKHKVAMDVDQKYSKGTTAKNDEVALAGKGFNPQVEAEFKRSNADLASAFYSVDRIEGFGATEAELKSFQASGKLQPK